MGCGAVLVSAGAFGGVGGHSAFGAKTGDVFTWITVGLTGLFILVAVIGNYKYVQTPVAAVSPAPVTPSGDDSSSGQPASSSTKPS